MEKQNKVSLWIGHFDTEKEFEAYVNGAYNKNGDAIPSSFQTDYGIKHYDEDFREAEWFNRENLSDSSVEALLTGFSYDNQIIPQFEKFLTSEDIKNCNSILLLYNFQYENTKNLQRKLRFVGCADAQY